MTTPAGGAVGTSGARRAEHGAPGLPAAGMPPVPAAAGEPSLESERSRPHETADRRTGSVAAGADGSEEFRRRVEGAVHGSADGQGQASAPVAGE